MSCNISKNESDVGSGIEWSNSSDGIIKSLTESFVFIVEGVAAPFIGYSILFGIGKGATDDGNEPGILSKSAIDPSESGNSTLFGRYKTVSSEVAVT